VSGAARNANSAIRIEGIVEGGANTHLACRRNERTGSKFCAASLAWASPEPLGVGWRRFDGSPIGR
jgi:hypothetical protein